MNQYLHSRFFSHRASLASGQPIGRLMALALNFPEVLSLAAGFVDNATLPCDAATEVLQELTAEPSLLRRALQYGSASGNSELRAAILDWSYRNWTQSQPTVDRVILTAGSNQFLHLLSEAVIDPEDIVIAASPTYFVFLGTLQGAGARVIGVRADEHGMCMDSLETALDQLAASGQASRLKAIYSVTDFDNPAGSTLSLERRHRLLEIARRWRSEQGPLVILSDNAYQHVRFEGHELPPLTALATDAADFVVELGTFSKSFSPGVRVGWGIVPQEMVSPLLELKSNIDFGSPHFSQILMNHVLRSGKLEAHLPVIQDGYRAKRDAMLGALQTEFSTAEGVHWREPQGGLYVWLTLPEHIDASENGQLWKCATESGVIYVPGNYCYPSEGVPIQNNTLRLSFGVQSCEGIGKGIARLAAAYREVSKAVPSEAA